ncbi:deoxyhypusine synthase [Candidatus Nomurabacteria bacterium RIFCSPLOWO2_12_FULL_44_11]|uniref:Deoxyhypusine synthase n=1 Tax=Candidatus Nomurabacteria bacterium RIFCSPLOWO2_12_FULL_44_11 TaxID=1801796 RepID=A0A1F6Y7L2_9BACT|nr:MAG: deoxyhypusine synthase [Candidatus Nomurabacteria bacterium RIFCSPLOWO2_12_FULL_44_11]
MNKIKDFIKHHYRHFNAAVVVDAAEAYDKFLRDGNKMMVTLAGAMSTAELGLSLAEMIRQDKVHAITCTGANLEEDIFNLVAHNHYVRVPHYRQLSPEDEVALLKRGLNRVTDTTIPEDEAMRRIERQIIKLWMRADERGERYFPYEFMYQMIREGHIKHQEIDPKDSWLLAACEKNIPIWTPGWEDSTLGNIFVALTRGRGENFYGKNIKNIGTVKSGLEAMSMLIDWYLENTKKKEIGFFQIGGGIAGDFPICVVPLIQQDLQINCKLWGYFCQISDSTTSYGSYSGAVPNEKITWGKLDVTTPRFVIESDATIVAPLIFAYVLNQ